MDGRETKTFSEARNNLLLACLITNNMCTDSKVVIHLTNFAIKMHLRLHEPSCDHLFQFQEQKAKSIIGTSIGEDFSLKKISFY